MTLGCQYPNQPETSFSRQFLTPLRQSIMTFLKQWDEIALFWMGKFSQLLPKFTYFLQTLPIPVSTSYMKTWQKTFTDFAWNYKKPRLSLQIIKRPLRLEGLGFPELKVDNEGAKLRNLMKLLNLNIGLL